MANQGTTKIKAISKRALQIREEGGFTTETIKKKRYKVAYIPTAIKQAAKELKSGGKVAAAKVKRSFTVVRKVKEGTGRVFFYPITETGLRITRTNFARKYDAEATGKNYVKLFTEKDNKTVKSKIRKVKTKQLARRKVTTKPETGAKLVMKTEKVRTFRKNFIRVKKDGKTFKQTYGVNAVTLIAKLELSRFYKPTIERVYAEITKREVINSVDFYGKLIEELAKSGKTLPNKHTVNISDVEGYEFVHTDKMPPKIQAGMFGLTKIVSTDKSRPQMCGVYVNDSNIVATDAHKLVVIKDVENQAKKYDNQIIGILKWNMKQVIDERYPNYKGVIPTFESCKIVSNYNIIDDLLPGLNGRALILKNIVDQKAVVLQLNGGRIAVDSALLCDILNTLKANGAKKVKFGYKGDSYAILIETDNKNTAILMPLLYPEIEEAKVFTVKPIIIN